MKRVIVAAALTVASQGVAAQEKPLLTSEQFNALVDNAGNGSPTLDYGRMKRNAEKAVRDSLIDPASGEFEWPYGFTYGTWKPILQKRISGYWTCGTVNAKNRMGGYVGRSTFVVVMQDADTSLFVDIGSGKYPIVDTQCRKSLNLLPPAPPEFADAPASAPATVPSVADELAKLAKLKADGVITQAEFDAQKAKLLGQ